MFGLGGLGLGGRAGGGLVVGAWTTTFWHATDPRSASKVINGSARLAMVALAQLIDDGRLDLTPELNTRSIVCFAFARFPPDL